MKAGMLAVDVGNTQVKIGWCSAGGGVILLPTRSNLSASQWQNRLDAALAAERIDPTGPAVVGSVVPAVTGPLCRALAVLTGQEPAVISPSGPSPLEVRYDDPSKLGVDRLANAVAAHARTRSAVIVVDLGTATKFECVSGAGVFLGGLSASGVRMGVAALTANTAQLPDVELALPPGPIATNTSDAIAAAAIYGTAAMIDGLVPRLEHEMGVSCRVIATGGYAPLIAPHSERVVEVAPHLTLEGLRLLYDFANRTSSPVQ
jgi:type III pantothenate kinase